MPKAVGISGSPRRGGNSETLLRAALEGAQGAGAEVELIRVNELTYVGCQNCEACIEAGQCTQDDDLAGVLAKLRAANVWLLASPIYFDSVSGQFKAFFDRCWCFIHKSSKLRGPRAGAILVTYEAKRTEFYEEVARRFAAYLPWFGKFDPLEVMAEAGLGPVDAAMQRADLLDKARELGKRLVESLSAS